MLDELAQMAGALNAHGLITKPDMAQIQTLCRKPPEFTPKKVAQIRKSRALMSQSVFAALLNVSVSTVQKWEAPDSGKHPTGAAARLLQLIERKGVEAIAV
ncbi:MAG: transcriptional regulator [Betaproteobacteria bacterium]|nr:transcriptional regulator [Betaproteobacteria bacterium]